MEMQQEFLQAMALAADDSKTKTSTFIGDADRVFVFGSFSEDEACFFQSSKSGPKQQEVLYKQLCGENYHNYQQSLKSPHKKTHNVEQTCSILLPKKQEALLEKNGDYYEQLDNTQTIGTHVESSYKNAPSTKGQENRRLVSNGRAESEIEKVEANLINRKSNGSTNHKKTKEQIPSSQMPSATLTSYCDQAADEPHLLHLTVSRQDPQDVASKSECIDSLVSGDYICGNNTVDKKGLIGSGETKYDILLCKDHSASVAGMVAAQSKHDTCHETINNGKGKCETPHMVHTGRYIAEPVKEDVPMMPLTGGGWLKSLEEIEKSGKRIQRRGLVNTGNLCFLNATLQALISCKPFVHLIETLKSRGTFQAEYPTLQAFADFSKQFEELDMDDKSDKTWPGEVKSIEIGRPFAPTMFDNILKKFSPDQPSGRNRRQEDAQEFLSFTMDHMHEELLRLESMEPFHHSQSGLVAASDADEDWETVGPKNRTSVIRTYTLMQSALSDIFGGQVCSIIKSKGNKASATIQPFLLLHLDILPDVVHSVEDALKFFAARESLENYRSASSKASVVSASKSLKIQTLPRVLILHLMRFSYGSGGSTKLHKRVFFPMDLTLSRELLASSTFAGPQGRRYELVATVTHHGRDPSHGHYTADSRQPDGQWLRFDDATVSIIGLNKVLHDQAYLLFYRRVAC